MGPHRSGTTLLYGMMGGHPQIGYLSVANKRFPSTPRLAHLFTRLGVLDKPREAQVVWDRFWENPDDVMRAEDATPRAVEWYRRTVATVLRLRKVERFLAKYPRLSFRMDWIDAVFPDALFIHILRDWRAVVNSTLNRRRARETRSSKWYGLRIPGWQEMGDVPREIVAGRQYRLATKAIEEEAPRFDGRFTTVRYADLCAEPLATMQALVDFCDLPWTPEFEDGLPRDLVSANHKWRETLDADCLERIRAEDPEFYAQHEEDG
jgi:hypothetical protein